jgi:hypothetical protein
MDLGVRHVTQLTVGTWQAEVLEWVRTMGRWARAWARLTDVVRTGGPAFGRDMRFTEDPAYTAEEDRTGPPFSALHSLSSIVLWDGGLDFSIGELTGYLREADFAAPAVFPVAGGSGHVRDAAQASAARDEGAA